MVTGVEILRSNVAKIGLKIEKISIVSHAHDRAGDFKIDKRGTMYVILQTGVNGGCKIAHARGCIKTSNGFYAIIELFEKSGKVFGKVLTTLSEHQLATSRNMNFGNHYDMAFSYEVDEIEEIRECYYGREYKGFLLGHPITERNMNVNNVEIKFSEAQTLKYAGFTYEGKPNGIKCTYQRLITKKIIVVC